MSDTAVENENVQRPYVWHDEKHYQRIWKRAAAIFAVAALAGLVPYFLVWNKYTDGWWAVLFVFVVVLAVLLAGFWGRLTDNLATFVKYEGKLYRLTDANRGITRMALDNSREYPEFERDFARACGGNTSWRFLEVEQIKEKGRGYEILCRVCLSKSGKECQKAFYLEEGYQEMELLLEELRGLQSGS